MTSPLTGALVVTAAAHGTVVWYTILASRSDGTELKTIRFSELDDMHGKLIKEVPSFPGRLPPKTLRRCSTPAFMENRRKAVEVYLRLVATHDVASSSSAWLTFFEGVHQCDEPQCDPATRPIGQLAPGADERDFMTHKSLRDEGSEDEFESLGNTVNDELKKLLSNKRGVFNNAQEAKNKLESSMLSVDQCVANAEAEAQGKASLEVEASARLRSHRESLEELDAQLNIKSMTCSDKERQDNEMTKRLVIELEEKLKLASDIAEKSQNGFDAARKNVSDASAKLHADITAATTCKVEAEAANADAVESHSSMTIALSVLQVRAKARMDDVSITERELDTLKVAYKVLAAESADAEALRSKVKIEAEAAMAAVAVHIKLSARRNRAHELEIRRAKDRASDAVALRDMRTRGLLMGDDRDALEPAEDSSNVAAEVTSEVLAKAEQAHQETKENDESKLDSLQNVASQANKNLRRRETIVASLAARMSANEASVEEASAKHAASVAPATAVQKRFEDLQQQVHGPLAEALPECAKKLEDATKALAAVRKAGEEEKAPLRHAEEVESQVLKSRQVEKESLEKALEEAVIASEEATEAYEATIESGPDFNLLVKVSEDRYVELDMKAQAAARVHKEALEAIVAVKNDLSCIDSDDDGDDNDDAEAAEHDNDDEDEAEAKPTRKDKERHSEKDKEREATRDRLAKQIQSLESVASAKNELSKEAAAAAKVAKEELETLRAQQKATPRPAEKLVREELNLVDAGLQGHSDKETAIKAQVKQRVVDWMHEKDILGAELHRAQLKAASAEEDVMTNKTLAKEIRSESAPAEFVQ